MLFGVLSCRQRCVTKYMKTCRLNEIIGSGVSSSIFEFLTYFVVGFIRKVLPILLKAYDVKIDVSELPKKPKKRVCAKQNPD